jgi:hypothetical protein
MTGSIRNLSPHFHVLTSPGLYEYSWKLHQADGAPNLLFRLLNPLGRVFPRKFRHEVFENSVNDLLLDLDEDRRAQLDLVWLHLTLIVKIGFLICGTLMAALEEVSGLYSLLALISKFLGK